MRDTACNWKDSLYLPRLRGCPGENENRPVNWMEWRHGESHVPLSIHPPSCDVQGSLLAERLSLRDLSRDFKENEYFAGLWLDSLGFRAPRVNKGPRVLWWNAAGALPALLLSNDASFTSQPWTESRTEVTQPRPLPVIAGAATS